MSTGTRFHTGQRVLVINTTKYTGRGVVEKHHSKNVDVRLDNGQKVRFDPFFLKLATGDDADFSNAAPIVVPEYTPAPQPGTVVRVDDKTIARTSALAGLWIVGGGQGNKSRLFRLNNTDGRYWRVPNTALIKVDAFLVEQEP